MYASFGLDELIFESCNCCLAVSVCIKYDLMFKYFDYSEECSKICMKLEKGLVLPTCPTGVIICDQRILKSYSDVTSMTGVKYRSY